jgi:hypothetical protein
LYSPNRLLLLLCDVSKLGAGRLGGPIADLPFLFALGVLSRGSG